MKSVNQESGVRFQVRWVGAAGDRIQQVEYVHYAQAEACFISLFSVVDRAHGGWVEIRQGERCLLDTSPDGGGGSQQHSEDGEWDDEEAEALRPESASTRNLA